MIANDIHCPKYNTIYKHTHTQLTVDVEQIASAPMTVKVLAVPVCARVAVSVEIPASVKLAVSVRRPAVKERKQLVPNAVSSIH